MGVPVPAEGGIALFLRLRQQGESLCRGGFGEAAEEAADHEAGAVGKTSSEPVADSSGGAGAAEFSHCLYQQRFRAGLGGGDCRRDSGGAAAGDDHVVRIV